MREGGLEPPRVAPPGSKPGASTNSATLAGYLPKRGTLLPVPGPGKIRSGEYPAQSMRMIRIHSSCIAKLPEQGAYGPWDLPNMAAEHQRDTTTRPLRILVVEDDASIREALCDVLRLAGHEADGAEHGKAGLEYLTRSVPDVILLDLRMPVMNGVEFLREIQPRKLPVRIIVLTANPQDLPPGTNIPMLAKPYDVERLLRVISGEPV